MWRLIYFRLIVDQLKMGARHRDGFIWIILPGSDLHISNPLTQFDDITTRVGLLGAAREHVVDIKINHFGHAGGLHCPH